MGKIKYVGILGMIVVMLSAFLLMPTAAFACNFSGSCVCVVQKGDTKGEIQATICVSHSVTITGWELYKNGKTAGHMVDSSSTLSQSIGGGCTSLTWETTERPVSDSDTYYLKIFYASGCFSSSVWIDECESCPPVPEIPTIALMSLGLMALGGVMWVKRNKQGTAVA